MPALFILAMCAVFYIILYGVIMYAAHMVNKHLMPLFERLLQKFKKKD